LSPQQQIPTKNNVNHTCVNNMSIAAFNKPGEPQERGLTSGNLHRVIWSLAVPMILESSVLNVSQLLDTYWIGKLGSAALAALMISSSIRWVINSMANGLGSGGLAVVARRIGENDDDAAAHATWQTIILGVIFSVLLAGIGLAVARPMLVLMGADAEVLPMGMEYLRITLVGLFTVVLIFAINSILRGAGEARLAMIVLFISTGVTVLAEGVLIFGLGPFPALGIAGSAWGIVLGFGSGVVFQMLVLLSGRSRVKLSFQDIRIDFPLMWQIIRISFPSMIQMFLRSSSRLIVLGLVGLYGTNATAGYGVANRMMLIAIIPGFGLSNTAATLVGQNLGALKPKRAEQTAWWVSLYGIVYMFVIGGLMFTFARPLISFFDPTPQVVEYGSQCLRIVVPTQIVYIVGIVLGRGFIGAGDTVPAMNINMLTLWGVEVPFSYLLSQFFGLDLTGIWLGISTANLSNGLLFAYWFRKGRWKQREV
jgi:putative MATE family efflux protein